MQGSTIPDNMGETPGAQVGIPSLYLQELPAPRALDGDVLDVLSHNGDYIPPKRTVQAERKSNMRLVAVPAKRIAPRVVRRHY